MTSPRISFAVSFDYRCPFARNAHEHVLAGLGGGAAWDVHFVPFSLGQVHVTASDPDVWDDPSVDSGLLALQVGVTVRDWHPEAFPQVHHGLFAARHDHGLQISDEAVVRDVLRARGVDDAAVFERIEGGDALVTVREEHEEAAVEHKVFGVPTFVTDGQAVFVRLMDRPGGDTAGAARTVERVLDLATGWPELNELKHTSIRR